MSQGLWNATLMKASLVSTKRGLSSGQEMKMLAPAGLPVQRADFRAGSASTVATFPWSVAVPTSWGQLSAFGQGHQAR